MCSKRNRNIILGCLISIYLFGCGSTIKVPGGSTSFEQTTSSTDVDGLATTTTTKVVVEQPDNAVSNGKLVITPQDDGSYAVETETGQSEKPSAIASIVSLSNTLSPVVYIGGGLMAIGAFVFIFGDKKGALVLFGFGAAMAGGAYLFSAYSKLFLILLLGALGWLGYTLWHKNQTTKTAVELIKTVEVAKGRLTEDDRKDIFEGSKTVKPIVAAVQSDATVRFFKAAKEKGLV